MGINCPDVGKVIHFHSPCTLLNYGQEAGRCTWEGWPLSPSKALLFLIPTKNLESAFQSLTKKKFKYQSENRELHKMKLYATNTAECRRVLLLNYLDGEADPKREIENSNVAKHNIIAVTFAHLHVNVRIAFLLKQWI